MGAVISPLEPVSNLLTDLQTELQTVIHRGAPLLINVKHQVNFCYTSLALDDGTIPPYWSGKLPRKHFVWGSAETSVLPSLHIAQLPGIFN